MLHQVSGNDTAQALGSGDVPVLATPRLIAWLEAETVRAATPLLAEGQTSVGTRIAIEHRRATPVGGTVEIAVRSTRRVDDRLVTFVVEAVDTSGSIVASGEIDRAIVDRSRFLATLG